MARQRKPTSVRSHRQSPAMNATTASFLGLGRRQRAQDLLREAPRKALRKALRRAPASQCARASQKRAIRIAAIASVHDNCTAQSRVTLIHCIAHQLLVNLVAGAVLAMFAPPGQGDVGPSVRMGRRRPITFVPTVGLHAAWQGCGWGLTVPATQSAPILRITPQSLLCR
jgi:hypothetical protein